MKFCVFLSLLLSASTVLGLRYLELSWPLSLIGGLLAISGMAILLFGCNVQRLLSNPEDESSTKHLFNSFLKSKPPRDE